MHLEWLQLFFRVFRIFAAFGVSWRLWTAEFQPNYLLVTLIAHSTTQGLAAQKLAGIHPPKAKREQLTNDVNNEVARASRGNTGILGGKGPKGFCNPIVFFAVLPSTHLRNP